MEQEIDAQLEGVEEIQIRVQQELRRRMDEANAEYYREQSYGPENNTIRCPKCGSTQITSKTQGFGLGKAADGGLLLGPVGLLGGLVGSKKIKVVCLNCGKEWSPR